MQRPLYVSLTIIKVYSVQIYGMPHIFHALNINATNLIVQGKSQVLIVDLTNFWCHSAKNICWIHQIFTKIYGLCSVVFALYLLTLIFQTMGYKISLGLSISICFVVWGCIHVQFNGCLNVFRNFILCYHASYCYLLFMLELRLS